MTVACWLLVAVFALPGGAAQASPTAVGEAYFLFLQGRALEARGDVTGAVSAYRRAIDLVPNAADVRAELAALYARIGRADLSISEAESALSVEPGNREAHRILGFVQAAVAGQTGDPAERGALVLVAIDHLEQALAGDVRDLGAELTLGRLYVTGGLHEEAIETLTAFLLDQPGYPEGMLLLADAYEAGGEPDDAAAVLARLVAASPEQLAAHVRLGELYEQSGRWREASSVWRDLAGPSADATYLIRQALALVMGGDPEGAERELRAVIDADPANADALNYLGSLLADGGERLDEAVALVSRALALDPANPSYLDSLGWAHFRQGRLDRALEPLERAAAALPGTAVVQDHLGDVYFGLKRYRDALLVWDRALAGDRDGLDVAVVTAKRDLARELAGRR